MDMLQVVNGKIADSSGKQILLRGTNLGGWMNMENFINGYPGSETGVRAAVAEVLGQGKAEFFFDRMLDHMFSEEDARFIKECGTTAVRIPLNYRQFEDDQNPFAYKESAFARLDEALGWCGKYGLYAILDLHAVQGWQNNSWHCDNDSSHACFWGHRHFVDRFIALWEEFARRYADNPVIAGYDIMNEPCSNAPRGRFTSVEKYRPDWDGINSIYRRAVSAIRRIDARHIIFLEGDYYAALFEGLEAPFTDNLAYSSHNYTASGFGPGSYPGAINGENWDRGKQLEISLAHEGLRVTQKHNVPLLVGEFGSVYNGLTGEIPDRLRAMEDQIGIYEANGIHWTTWTYKDVGVMGLVTLNPESEYMQIVTRELESKALLDADQWMNWLPETPAKALVRKLAHYTVGAIGDDELEPEAVYTYMRHRTLSGYVGSLMQPSYARLFKGMTEEQIGRVMESFALKNCVRNTGLIEILRKHAATPAG